MTNRLISFFFCLLALLVPAAAHAQAAKSEVLVKYYRFDEATQKLAPDAQWKWENVLRYANLSTQFVTQGVLSTSNLSRVNRKTDLYEIIETDPEGNVARRILLQGGAMSIITYKRAFGYFRDAQNLLKALQSDLAKQIEKPQEKPDQPLMSILAIMPDTGKPFVWRTNKPDDVMLIGSYLRGIPAYTDNELRNLSTDFKGPGSFRIEMHTQKFANIPMEISVEEASIRTAIIEQNTTNYYDNVNLLAELKAQHEAFKETSKP